MNKHTKTLQHTISTQSAFESNVKLIKSNPITNFLILMRTGIDHQEDWCTFKGHERKTNERFSAWKVEAHILLSPDYFNVHQRTSIAQFPKLSGTTF